MDIKTWQQRNLEEIEKMNDKSNFMGKLLYLIGGIICLIGILTSVFYSLSLWPLIISGILIAAFGEIIDLLQKIYVNTKQQNYQSSNIQERGGEDS